MHKIKKFPMIILTMAAGILTSTLNAGKVSANALSDSGRIWGNDRYETAAKISQAGWASSKYVIIASGEGYADALCAAPLAQNNNAPILLTNSNELNRNALDELRRLQVKDVYIVGGEASVSKEVEEKIKYLTGADIQRLAGKNRYETAVKVAEKLPETEEVILASGEGYADALSAAPVAAIRRIPILLTASNELPTFTSDYLKKMEVKSTYVIGGTASVSDTVKKLVPNGERICGGDRFGTNTEVIKAFSLDFDFKNAYVALASGESGNEFADALAGSALAGKMAAPVILTGKNLDNSTKRMVDEVLSPSSKITALGGTNNISDLLIDGMKIKAAEYLSNPTTTYSKDVKGNVVVANKEITLKDMRIDGNLYIEEKDVTLSNVTVYGSIYINHGVEGVCKLDKVSSNNIFILSGDKEKDSVQLRDVLADNLNIFSNSIVRIVSQGSTKIKNTKIASNAILENRGGVFGEVKIPKTFKYKDIEFNGTIKEPIIIEGQADIKAPYAGYIPKIEVRADNDEKILFDGKFDVIEVYTAVNIKVSKETRATVRAEVPEAQIGAQINIPWGANVDVENFRGANITRDGE